MSEQNETRDEKKRQADEMTGLSLGSPEEHAILLLDRAVEIYAELSAGPEREPAILHNWAVALLLRARRPEVDDARHWLLLAREKFLETEKLVPGLAAFNIGCISAQLGEENECQRWLETALKEDVVPGRATVAEEADLESVRATEWFEEFLTRVPEGEDEPLEDAAPGPDDDTPSLN